jgi:exopolysaccharide production protein ExoZ
VATIISVALLASGDPRVTPGSLFQSLFFIPYVSTDYGQIIPLLGVGWTLNYEMFFYALFTIALLWPRQIALPVLFAALGYSALIGRLMPLDAAPLRFWFDPIVLEFAFGMGLALLYRQKIILPGNLRLLMIAIAVTVIYLGKNQITGAGLQSGTRAFVWGIPVAIIFAAAILGRPMRHNAVLVALGDASYSSYLWHPIIVTIIAVNWGSWFSHFPVYLVMAGGLICTVLASLFTYRLIETPPIRFFAKRLARQVDVPRATAAAGA